MCVSEIWGYGEWQRKRHTTNKEALTDSSGKRPSLRVWSWEGWLGLGPPAGVGATVPGTGGPLDAQEPCLQLCQCDLRDDSAASLRTRLRPQRRQGGSPGDGEENWALPHPASVGGRPWRELTLPAHPCLSESRGLRVQKGH